MQKQIKLIKYELAEVEVGNDIESYRQLNTHSAPSSTGAVWVLYRI